MLFALRLTSAVRSLSTSAARPAAMAKNFYAVAAGRQRGLFRSWEQCQQQVRVRRRRRPCVRCSGWRCPAETQTT